jgi:hypothetical protein
VDKELALLFKFPGFVRRIIMAAIRTADRFGALPPSFIEHDPMYASAFLAHMASFGMPAGYHHLYEYGTVGTFCVLGRPTTDPDSPTFGPDRRRRMRVCWTFDERCEDGYVAWNSLETFRSVLEDPVAAGLDAGTPEDTGATAAAEAPDHHRAGDAALP